MRRKYWYDLAIRENDERLVYWMRQRWIGLVLRSYVLFYFLFLKYERDMLLVPISERRHRERERQPWKTQRYLVVHGYIDRNAINLPQT